MGHQALVLSIFVSSPGDVSEDRTKVLSAISAWNQRNGASRNVFFNPLTWEGVVAPDRGQSGQHVINEQIGTSYDIYLGLMWGRFGSPTQDAQSGTEDEFDQAISRHKSGEKLAVAFLFNGQPIPQQILDGNQFQKVQDFKKKVASEGCLYREYVDDLTLSESINLILDRAANHSKKRIETQGPTPVIDDVGDRSKTGESAGVPEELGLLDIQEALDEQTKLFASAMDDWGARLIGITASAEAATDEMQSISRFGDIEPSAMKRIVNKVAKKTEAVVDWGEIKQNEIDDIIERSSELYANLVLVSQDFNTSQDDLLSAIQAGEDLIEAIRNANGSMKSLAKTALSSPRISKEVIRSNKRLAALLDRMILKNQTFGKNIEIANTELIALVKK